MHTLLVSFLGLARKEAMQYVEQHTGISPEYQKVALAQLESAFGALFSAFEGLAQEAAAHKPEDKPASK